MEQSRISTIQHFQDNDELFPAFCKVRAVINISDCCRLNFHKTRGLACKMMFCSMMCNSVILNVLYETLLFKPISVLSNLSPVQVSKVQEYVLKNAEQPVLVVPLHFSRMLPDCFNPSSLHPPHLSLKKSKSASPKRQVRKM